MASRSTRNQSILQGSTDTSNLPDQTSPRKARKSFRNSGSQNTRSSKKVRKASSASSDSSDSEEAGKSSKRRSNRRGAKILDSDEVSDDEYVPPSKSEGKSKPLPTSSKTNTSSATPLDTADKDVSDVGSTSSQNTTIAGRPTTQDTFKKLVNKFVYYTLVADQKKHAIKKADIVKYVFENENSKENYSQVVVKANEVLKKTFGFELLKTENKSNSYILINILDPDHGIKNYAEYSSEKLQKQGLIFLILTIIFMNDNKITEDKLWHALEPFGLNPNSQIPHPVFGDEKKYITSELVKQMYLKYTLTNKDPIQHEIEWGIRADQEVKKEDLLQFACKIMDDTKPEDWKLQYNDIHKAQNAASET